MQNPANRHISHYGVYSNLRTGVTKQFNCTIHCIKIDPEIDYSIENISVVPLSTRLAGNANFPYTSLRFYWLNDNQGIANVGQIINAMRYTPSGYVYNNIVSNPDLTLNTPDIVDTQVSQAAILSLYNNLTIQGLPPDAQDWMQFQTDTIFETPAAVIGRYDDTVGAVVGSFSPNPSHPEKIVIQRKNYKFLAFSMFTVSSNAAPGPAVDLVQAHYIVNFDLKVI